MIRELLFGTPITEDGKGPSLAFVELWARALTPVAPGYTVATLPDAARNPRAMVFVSDEAGGAVLAFSDGTNWRRSTDRAIVS